MINGCLHVHLVCACDEIGDAFTLLRPNWTAVRACSVMSVVFKLMVPVIRCRIRWTRIPNCNPLPFNGCFVAKRFVDRIKSLTNPKPTENNTISRSINIEQAYDLDRVEIQALARGLNSFRENGHEKYSNRFVFWLFCSFLFSFSCE